MEFKKENVYTSVNADELKAGDLVIVSDSLAGLQNNVDAEKNYLLIKAIRPDYYEKRFFCSTHYDYGLAYLVERADPYKELKEAYAAGKTIQSWNPLTEEWCDVSRPTWFDYVESYRIKPEPIYRPFNDIDELCAAWAKKVGYNAKPCTMPLIWVQFVDSGNKYAITEFAKSVIAVGGQSFSLGELHDCCTFLDGSPFGVEVAE